MKILYISCHQILEYDEVKLLHELGYDIFSAGTYAFPHFRPGMLRPGIDTLPHYPDLERLASTIDSSGGNIPEGLIEWADTIIFMHRPEWLEKNWQKLKHKRVIFRSIGQNVPIIERLLAPMRAEGLQIIRYSPKEANILDFVGEDAMIRFYKDPAEFGGYTGNNPLAINFTQSIRQRARFCGFHEINKIMEGYPHKIYGVGNEDLGDDWGGELTDDMLKSVMRESRAYVYGGTWPASYTLSFIEAFMTGIPILAIGSILAQGDRTDVLNVYEIEDFIENGKTGFISNDLQSLHQTLGDLLSNQKLCLQMSEASRARAIELFGKENIAVAWREFLGE